MGAYDIAPRARLSAVWGHMTLLRGCCRHMWGHMTLLHVPGCLQVGEVLSARGAAAHAKRRAGAVPVPGLFRGRAQPAAVQGQGL